MSPHPRLTGASAGAVLGATYAVPESALGAGGVWAQEDWCRPCWLTPRTPGKRAGDEPDAPFCVAATYVHDGGARWVHFPRAVGLALFGPPARDVRTEGEPVADAVEFVGTLLSTPVPQVQAVNAIVHALTKTRARMGCAVMRCGFGKTVCAVAVICRMRRKTAILVHTKQLAEQWRDRIGAFAPAARVCLHSNVHRSGAVQTDADVTIVIVQTAMRQESLADVGLNAHRFGLVVVDETHHIAARIYSRALRLFPAAAVLGLTATPKRSDGMEKLVYWLVGYPCFTALDSDYREETVATLARVELPPPALRTWPAHLRASAGASAYAAAERVSDGMVAKLTSAVGANDVYARAVARDIMAKYAAGRNVLVMSTRRSQLMLLARWMRSEAARAGAIAHVSRGVLADRDDIAAFRQVTVAAEETDATPVVKRARAKRVSRAARVRLELEIDAGSALAPPLAPLDGLVRAAGARVGNQGERETLTTATDQQEARTKRARAAAASAAPAYDACVRVRVLRIDHGIGGDLCVGVVPAADNLLVVIKDWNKLSVVSRHERVVPGAARADSAAGESGSESESESAPVRSVGSCGGDDDDDDDDAPRVTQVGQRLRMHSLVRYPPVILRSDGAPAATQITDREVLHGACGLHRDSERAMQSHLYAYGVLRLRKQLPRAIVDRVLALATPVVRVGFCVGGMPTARWKPQLDCGILLSTSQQCAEGFDDPKRDTLVMTLPPRGNLKQLFGRVQRPCPIKARPTRLVLYHLDETDTVFGRKVSQWSNAVARDGFERAPDDKIAVTGRA